MSPRITIGMATYNDYEGVWATAQSIHLHNNWNSPNDVETIIVDTSPQGSEHRRLVQEFVAKRPIKYIDMAGVVGTTLPRDIIFQHATAPFTVVMDCHVMLPSNTLLQLTEWFEANPNCHDLIHGPILYDDLVTTQTHMVDQFRGGMWGTWGTAWLSPEGRIVTCEGEEVTDEPKLRRNSNGQVTFYDLMTMEVVPGPVIPFAGHQKRLVELGYKELTEPFEIPGMGMGLFASRTDSWLGFAKGCSGFGGEEMNIHTKYRQAGRKAICLPFLKWNHRFGRAGGAPYPIPLAAKVRNYVLWAKELNNPINSHGVSLLDRIRTHFNNFNDWDRLLTDPMNYPVDLTPPPQEKTKPMDDLFYKVANKPRDLNEHAEIIRKLASQVDSVVAFVKRGEWEPMLAAGFPKSLTVYQTENSEWTKLTHEAHQRQSTKDNRELKHYTTHQGVDPLHIDPIEPPDLLVLDQYMRMDYVLAVLRKHHATKYILLRGTQSFGEQAEFDPTHPGLWEAMKIFLKENPQWHIVAHYPKQYGITILSTRAPEKEIRPWPLGYGPGTELKGILASVGINPSVNCSCNSRMRQMDEWGVEGCKEHFDTIVGWLEEKAEEWGWKKAATTKAEDDPAAKHFSLGEKLSIGWKSLLTGIALKVDWSNPYPGLVKEAIKRAEEKQQ